MTGPEITANASEGKPGPRTRWKLGHILAILLMTSGVLMASAQRGFRWSTWLYLACALLFVAYIVLDIRRSRRRGQRW